MNNQSSLYRYIQPQQKRRIGLLVFALLTVCCIVGAVVANATWEMPAPVPMTANTESGTYCTIEVQYMSDWILKVTGDSNYTYYEAGDPAGNWYSVRLNESEYAQFEEIVAYTFGETETAPAPITVTGTAYLVPNDDIEHLADYYEVSEEEYESYFGKCYLSVGSEPAGHYMGWVFGAVLFALFLLVLGIEYFSIMQQQKRTLETLAASGTLPLAEADIESAAKIVFEKQGLILGERYVFGCGNGIVLPYGDILWVYKHVKRRLFVPISTELVANLYDGRAVVLSKRGLKDDVIAEIAGIMLARNPELMIGFTRENRRAYRELLKA